MKRSRPLIVVVIAGAIAVCIAILMLANTNGPPKPGQKPTDRGQITRIATAREQLATALQKEDANDIATSESKLREALGQFAGVPERQETLNPKNTKAYRPSRTDITALSQNMSRMGSGSDEANSARMPARNVAYFAIGLLALSETTTPHTAAFQKQAAIELDWLIAKQDATGFFPYPVNPLAEPHLQKQAAQAAEQHPDKVRNGYIYLDVDGAQFDVGCAGYALAYGYQILKEPRFLEAARLAGDWALDYPLSANWNYNAFTVWQLAKIYEVTGEEKFLRRAVQIAKLGVLPGQMDSGHWSDQHNARSEYHWIIVRGLVALLRAMPQSHPDAPIIQQRTKLAIQSRVDRILQTGGNNSETAVVALVEALEYYGANQQWEQALAMIGGDSPYAAGIFVRWQRRG
jgi:hypothetical protein